MFKNDIRGRLMLWCEPEANRKMPIHSHSQTMVFYEKIEIIGLDKSINIIIYTNI